LANFEFKRWTFNSIEILPKRSSPLAGEDLGEGEYLKRTADMTGLHPHLNRPQPTLSCRCLRGEDFNKVGLLKLPSFSKILVKIRIPIGKEINHDPNHITYK
jgi:hypothetical protein